MSLRDSAIHVTRLLVVVGLVGTAILTPCSGRAMSSMGPTEVSTPSSQRLAEVVARISRATSITVFQVDGWYPKCQPWTFPRDRVIDCRRIMQEVQAPSRAWRDSLVALLTSPGALVPPREDLCLSHDDAGLRLASGSETTTVWLATGCGRAAILTPASAIWADFHSVRSKLRALVDSVLPPIAHESLFDVGYFDTPASLIRTPELPPELFVGRVAQADTVILEALVGGDGRVMWLVLKHSVAGFDSLAASLVSRYEYKPALSGGRPVRTWIPVAVPVPKPTR